MVVYMMKRGRVQWSVVQRCAVEVGCRCRSRGGQGYQTGLCGVGCTTSPSSKRVLCIRPTCTSCAAGAVRPTSQGNVTGFAIHCALVGVDGVVGAYLTQVGEVAESDVVGQMFLSQLLGLLGALDVLHVLSLQMHHLRGECWFVGGCDHGRKGSKPVDLRELLKLQKVKECNQQLTKTKYMQR